MICLCFNDKNLAVKSINLSIKYFFSKGGMQDISSISSKFVDILMKLEAEYICDNASRDDLSEAVKRLNYEYTNLISTRSPGDGVKSIESTIALYIILDRIKKVMLFENKILNCIDSEINFVTNSLSSNLSSELSFGSVDSISFGNNSSITRNSIVTSHQLNAVSQSKSKSKRMNYPKNVSKILQNWLKENIANPYPSENEKCMLIESTGLNSTQINNWFINARRRTLPYLKNKIFEYE